MSPSGYASGIDASIASARASSPLVLHEERRAEARVVGEAVLRKELLDLLEAGERLGVVAGVRAGAGAVVERRHEGVVLLAPRDRRRPRRRPRLRSCRAAWPARARSPRCTPPARCGTVALGDRGERLVGLVARLLRLRRVEPGLRLAGALLGREGPGRGLGDRGPLAHGGGVELLGGHRRLDDDARRPVERLLRRPPPRARRRRRAARSPAGARRRPSAGRAGSRPGTRARSPPRRPDRPCTTARRRA